MGTNYYAVRTRPTTDEPIHIGKASIGWKFLFQAMDEKYNEPPVVWNTYDQVYEWLYKHTVESNDYVIIDEYDEVISFDDFIELVEEKQNENNKDDFTYARNVNGYRFTDGWFCQERGDNMTKREFLDIVFALAPNEANKIMDAFDEYVESNEPHWIPVTENCDCDLMDNEEVLVFQKDGTINGQIRHAMFYDFNGKKKFVTWEEGITIYNVLAYMPLPEPFKGVNT